MVLHLDITIAPSTLHTVSTHNFPQHWLLPRKAAFTFGPVSSSTAGTLWLCFLLPLHPGVACFPQATWEGSRVSSAECYLTWLLVVGLFDWKASLDWVQLQVAKLEDKLDELNEEFLQLTVQALASQKEGELLDQELRAQEELLTVWTILFSTGLLAKPQRSVHEKWSDGPCDSASCTAKGEARWTL